MSRAVEAMTGVRGSGVGDSCSKRALARDRGGRLGVLHALLCHSSILAIGALTALHPTAALAQAATADRPSTQDENGVDVIYDQFSFSDSVNSFSMGPLVYDHTVGSNPQDVRPSVTHLVLYEYPTGGPSGSYVTLLNEPGGPLIYGDGSKYFDQISTNPYTWKARNGDQSYIVQQGTNYVYHTIDGDLVTYDGNTGSLPHVTSIKHPNGEIITIANKEYDADPGSGTDWIYVGPQTISTNTGYMLQFEYNTSNQITAVNGFNLASDVCAVGSASCTLVAGRPRVTYSYATNSVTATNAAGAVSQFYLTGTLSGASSLHIREPTGYTGNFDNVLVNLSGGYVKSIVKGGGTWNYTFYFGDRNSTSWTNVVDPNGKATYYTYVYDPDGLSNRLLSRRDPLLNTTTYAYDSTYRLNRITYPEGNYISLTRDSFGNITQHREVSKTPGTPPDIVRYAAFPASCSNLVTCHKPTSATDARNNQTTLSWDPTHGGLTNITRPAPATNGARPQTRYTYATKQAYYKNGSGQIVASGQNIYLLTATSACLNSDPATGCSGLAEEAKTTIDYGPQTVGVANNLQPVSVTRASGNGSVSATTSQTFAANGSVASIDGPLSGTADTSVYFYDAMGRETGEIDPDPDDAGASPYPATRITHDSQGRVTLAEEGTATAQNSSALASMTVLGSSTTSYDALDRPLVVTAKGSDGVGYALTQATYNTAGQTTCVAQRMNTAVYSAFPAAADACTLYTSGTAGPDRITNFHYDDDGRVDSVTAGYGTGDQTVEQTTAFTANGRTASVKDARGDCTMNEYDGFDRLIKKHFPSTTTGATCSLTADYEQYGYDPNGNVTSLRTRRAETIIETYDNLNRLTTKVVPERSGLSSTYTRDVYFGYDLLNDMTYARFDNAGGEGLTFAYDALGRQISETQAMDGVSRTLGYQYDAAGNRTRLTYADNNYVQYLRRASGDFYYANLNNSSNLFYPTLDSTGRPYRLYRYSATSASWAQWSQFNWNTTSRLASLGTEVAGTTYDTSTSLTYNPASQVTLQDQSNTLFAYSSNVDVDRLYSANGLNQYSQITTIPAITYDANGNLTSASSDQWPTDYYTYDVENRMVGHTYDTFIASVRYDPLGRLYEIVGNAAWSGTKRYLYDGSDLVAEYDGSGAMLRRYVHGDSDGDDPQVWFEGPGVSDTARRYLYADENSSVFAVTDGSGNVTATSEYDDFGVPYSTSAPPFMYTGQKWIAELGMYYYKARMYSPTLGRFMQTDPIGYGDGMNLYAYVHNDPVNSYDPSGMDADCPASATDVCATGQASGPTELPPAGGCPVGAPGCTGNAIWNSDGSIDIFGKRRPPSLGFFNTGTILWSNLQAGSSAPDPLSTIPHYPHFDVMPGPLSNLHLPVVSDCVRQALAKGALELGVDAIGLIPEGGGAKSIVRGLGHLRGYRGVVADNFGRAAIRKVNHRNEIVGAGVHAVEGDWTGIALDVAGFIPVVGQIAAGVSMIKDGYETWEKVQACP